MPSSGAIDGTCQRPDAPDPGMRPPRGLVQSIPGGLPAPRRSAQARWLWPAWADPEGTGLVGHIGSMRFMPTGSRRPTTGPDPIARTLSPRSVPTAPLSKALSRVHLPRPATDQDRNGTVCATAHSLNGLGARAPRPGKSAPRPSGSASRNHPPDLSLKLFTENRCAALREHRHGDRGLKNTTQ